MTCSTTAAALNLDCPVRGPAAALGPRRRADSCATLRRARSAIEMRAVLALWRQTSPCGTQSIRRWWWSVLRR